MVRAFAIDALRHRNRREGKIAIGSVLRAILAIEALDDLGELGFPCGTIEALDDLSIFVAELFLSLALSLFYAWKETV